MTCFPICLLSYSQLLLSPFSSGTFKTASKEFSRSITRLWERNCQQNRVSYFSDQAQNRSLCFPTCSCSRQALTQATTLPRRRFTMSAKQSSISTSEDQLQNSPCQTTLQATSLSESWKNKPAISCWAELNGYLSKWRCLRPNTGPLLSARSTLEYTSATR